MTRVKHNLIQVVLLYLLSVVLTATTFVLGAMPLKLVQEKLSPVIFWSVSLVISVAFFISKVPLLGISFLSLTVLLGAYDFFRKKSWSLEAASLTTLTLTSLLSVGFYEYYKSAQDSEWYEQVKSIIRNILGQSQNMKGQDLEALLSEVLIQIPSAIMIALSMSLLMSLVFYLNVKKSEPAKFFVLKSFLKNFTLPSFFIWLFMAALLGSFIEEVYQWHVWIKPVSLNALNVIVFLYFFQGLAILFSFYDAFQIGPFGRVIWTVIFVLQLFLVLSLIGVSDFWLNYRMRMRQRMAKIRNKTNRSDL